MIAEDGNRAIIKVDEEEHIQKQEKGKGHQGKGHNIIKAKVQTD